MIIVAVVGNKNSGKTMIIESLIRKFSRKGYRIAAVKHIPEPNFTIDSEGKDTWRFRKAGALKVVSVAPKEVAIIKDVDTGNFTLKEIIDQCGDVDIIFLEGFKELVAKRMEVPKIVAVKSVEEALNASKRFNSILAFAGFFSRENLNLNVPYFNIEKDFEKLVGMVENLVGKKKRK